MSTEINADLVRHIGRLSRIDLNDQQVDAYTRQLGEVLNALEKLQQLDTDDIAPMVHAVEQTNVLADDVTRESLPTDAALANAPQCVDEYFQVPRVLGEGS